MEFEKIKDKFGTWADVFRSFIESERFDYIFSYLKNEKQVNKKTIIPLAKDLFKSFLLCDKSKIKAIVVFMDPYPSIKKQGKEDIMIANGIPLDCSNTGIQQTSLSQWYGALTDTYGFDPDMEQKNDISYLLTEEHVLLLNSSLTVAENTPGSHTAVWKEFMVFFFSEVINQLFSGLPIVLVGKQAQQYEGAIDPMKHYILKVEHPAAAEYQKRAWDHGNLFKWINKIIENNNGPQHKIEWKRDRVWQETRTKWEDLPSGKKDKITGEWVRSDMPWDNVDLSDVPF